MKHSTTLLVGTLLLASVGTCQELLVFPAVTDNVPGLYDSLWVTDARVVKVNPNDWVNVRRKWVCLPEGGFLDDPATAPVWDTDWRVAVMRGRDLLAGTGASTGAVGLEVEGGPVLAHAHVADTSRGLTVPGAAYGQGQLIPAFREPLRGPSHIPWLGGCQNKPCALSPPLEWNYMRNNIGVVNPNPEPLTLRGTVIAFVYYDFYPYWGFLEAHEWPPENFEREVPPYGWSQFSWAGSQNYDGFFLYPPPIGFIISLTPEPDLPYYAYASVVFTPDPDSGVPPFSDPMYVPAEPGYIAPWSEVPPPR